MMGWVWGRLYQNKFICSHLVWRAISWWCIGTCHYSRHSWICCLSMRKGCKMLIMVYDGADDMIANNVFFFIDTPRFKFILPPCRLIAPKKSFNKSTLVIDFGIVFSSSSRHIFCVSEWSMILLQSRYIKMPGRELTLLMCDLWVTSDVEIQLMLLDPCKVKKCHKSYDKTSVEFI